MKILTAIIIPPHLSSSGAVNAAMAITHSLQRHCDIDIALMSDESCEEQWRGVRLMKRKATTPIDFTSGWLPNKYRTLFYRSDIASLVGQYDLVHLHNAIPALELKRVAKACLKQNIPYVITTHGFVEILGMRSAWQLNLLQSIIGKQCMMRPVQFVIDHAACICCLAPQDQALLNNIGVAFNKTVVIPNGVAKDYYVEPDASDVIATCEKFHLPPNKSDQTPICFFVANHTRNKGLDILLEAFLGSKRPYCLVVGGKKRDYDYAGFAARAGANQRIVFTDGLTDHEIRCLHHYSDLFVFPSRADTLPLVVLEAMASGRPVLSTKVGGIPFQIDDTCGRLVEPEDAVALREAFEALVEQPEKLKAMGRAALARVQANFDWDRSADQTYALYRKLLGLPAEQGRGAPSLRIFSDAAG